MFIWGHALHELGEPPSYSLGKLDPNADPDTELQTVHRDTYLLRRPMTEQKGVFIFDFGKYEELDSDQKATVQGFCKERIRILHKAWPTMDVQYWRKGGWFEVGAPGASGGLKAVWRQFAMVATVGLGFFLYSVSRFRKSIAVSK